MPVETGGEEDLEDRQEEEGDGGGLTSARPGKGA